MKIRAMIVDESKSSIRKLSEILESDHSFDVVCTLSNEKEVSNMVGWLSPDVVLMQIALCKRGEKEIFDYLLKKRIPLVLTGHEKDLVDEDFIELLEKGAMDFLSLPGEKNDFIRRVKSASMAKPRPIIGSITPLSVYFPGNVRLRKIIVIASSTGGPNALRQIIPKIPKNFPGAIIIVQHIGKGFTGALAKSLDMLSEIRVKEAEDGDTLTIGAAFIAPHGYHLQIEDSVIVLKSGKPLHGVIPAADITMKSVSKVYGNDVIGVILTGMGKDGAKGVEEIKNNKGRTIVQDKETSAIFGMPYAALMTGKVDKVVGIDRIPEVLLKEVTG
jgi:two-component system chemotaxis response regulator CheB